MKAAFNFYRLINPSPDKERDSSREFADEGKGDVDDESNVELDGNDQLDLDLYLEHNDDYLESDLLSDSKDRAGSAEEFLWSPILSEQVLSLRILIYYTPPTS